MSKKTPVFVHLVMAVNVMFAFAGENWNAGIAWAVAWLFTFLYDFEAAKFAKSIAIANLFFKAHDCKWPNAKAEQQAALALAEFEKNQK